MVITQYYAASDIAASLHPVDGAFCLWLNDSYSMLHLTFSYDQARQLADSFQCLLSLITVEHLLTADDQSALGGITVKLLPPADAEKGGHCRCQPLISAALTAAKSSLQTA